MMPFVLLFMPFAGAANFTIDMKVDNGTYNTMATLTTGFVQTLHHCTG
jgi:hypothetical protein